MLWCHHPSQRVANRVEISDTSSNSATSFLEFSQTPHFTLPLVFFFSIYKYLHRFSLKFKFKHIPFNFKIFSTPPYPWFIQLLHQFLAFLFPEKKWIFSSSRFWVFCSWQFLIWLMLRIWIFLQHLLLPVMVSKIFTIFSL